MTTNRIRGSFGRIARTIVVAALAGAAGTAAAQDMLQLVPLAPEYTLGRFRYEPPKVDGWRQNATSTDSLSIIYAEQNESDGAVDIRFGVVMEAHDIPPEAMVPDAQFLAETSRKQVADQRKADLVAISPVAAVPSTENLFTYRLLVRTPSPENPQAYEVYYVAMAPDKSQYVVVQCITKNEQYEAELPFNQFYASLPSLKYKGAGEGTPPPSGEAAPAAKSTE